MLDAVSYQKNIIAARVSLTKGPLGVVFDNGTPTKPVPTTFSRKDRADRFAKFLVMDDEAPLQVLIGLENLYVCGWFNRHGSSFIAKDCEYAINPGVKLPYSFDYTQLGYNQSQSSGEGTVNLATLNAALAQLFNASTRAHPDTFKGSIVQLAIGLSEAMRFSDVMKAIIKGEALGRLNWDNDRSDIQVLSPT